MDHGSSLLRTTCFLLYTYATVPPTPFLNHSFNLNSMEQSPSGDDNKSSASQLIPRTLRSPKFHDFSQRPASCPFRSQINPVHTTHYTSGKSILVLYSYLRLGLQMLSSVTCPHQTPCMHLSSPLYMLHVPPISFFLT
jgi:hypothetical protein